MKKLYELRDEGDTLTITDVPIMEMGEDVKGLTVDQKFFDEAIATHQSLKEKNGYLPAVFVGHNDDVTEKEAVGFFDNLKVKGETLYADLVQMDKGLKLKSFPYRSVEIFKNRISGLALLGSNAPFFKLSPVFQEAEASESIISFNSLTPMPMAKKLQDGEVAGEVEAVVEETKEEVVEPVTEEVKEEVKEEVEDVKASEATISLAEHNRVMKATVTELKAKLDETVAKLRDRELNEVVAKYQEKILPKQKSGLVKLMKNMSEQNVTALTEFLEGLPALKLTEELGSAAEGSTESAPEGIDPESHKVDLAVKALMEQDPSLSYGLALTKYIEASK
jgi:hypothetical protein